jgi:hypothetical protein
MIKAAGLTTKNWHEFLNDFVDDTDLVLCIKPKSQRSQWSGYDAANIIGK